MKKSCALFALLIATTLSASAYADADQKIKISGTDAAGTSYDIDQKVKVKNHMDGTTETTVKTEEVDDPKGLFNKSKVKSKEVVTSDKAGNIIKDKKTVNGKVVDEATAVDKNSTVTNHDKVINGMTGNTPAR